MSALSFTSPLVLGALAALPIIWLLLRAMPPAPQRKPFPAFIILRQLTAKEETPDKTPWWLLLLRLALAGIIILALAGPILNAPPETQQRGPLVLILDDSWPAANHWRARQDVILEAAASATQNNRPFFIVPTAPRRASDPVAEIPPDQADEIARSLAPHPYTTNRIAIIPEIERIHTSAENQPLEIKWLSDGVAGNDDQAFVDAIKEFGDVTHFTDETASGVILRPLAPTADGLSFSIERLNTNDAWEGALIALARDGRELARVSLELEDGESSEEVLVGLPLALRNELNIVRVESYNSAGGVQLIDARNRRALIGLADRGRPDGAGLLEGAHYIRAALGPYGELMQGSVETIIAAEASVLILDDIGALRASDLAELETWVEKGGVLIRFAGPNLAEAAQDRAPAMLPVNLRGGGRAFGGALTWETPQRLDAFPPESPFTGIAVPTDVFVRRQILAQPGGDTTMRTWARLEDGTPLVTGETRGAGAVVLFHVTATPQWSDLPISETFIEMLRKLTFLSALGPENADTNPDIRLAPIRLIDGFGRLSQANGDDVALTAAQLAEQAGPHRLPGFYGSPDAALSLNAVTTSTEYSPIKVSGVTRSSYIATPPQQLSPYLFSAALILLLLDGILALAFAGKLRPSLRSATAAIAAPLVFLTIYAPSKIMAQPLDAEIERQAAETALQTRLAYVETGDAALDRLSEHALAALSRELHRRTALEPGPPARVNPETDDLSVYPFIYWPVIASAPTPSDAALANIENFMNSGGLLLFDTRDDERAIGARTTPEGQALQRILAGLDIPPLKPIDRDHVLTRSFYLVSDLHGRLYNKPVWVAAETSGGNDGVTPIIIGGRDWAGAWASDTLGQPLRPMSPRSIAGRVCTSTPRECAYRAGINIVMVAFTGNYKSDQVHTPVLLERLGQ